ncbi:glycosyltransferase [Flavobacterium sp. H122]|uniref:glycosyltransferase n=1 Tax=Flavobacterium sp. H122 TaxID=2529860 RepID=UPI0010AA757B|nr:glycosyltransferase [Flavobacterium sp. H122]
MFKHLLITRFNLRNPKWDFTKNNESLLNDEWMHSRMQLFKNFCLPSVCAQSTDNFQWLIYFDTTTSEIFKEEISKLVQEKNNIKVFFIDGMNAFYPSIKEYIKNITTPFLITSRIDNDDCIHKDFIKTIQQNFNQQNFQAIDIIKGYSLQIEPEIILGKKEHIFNPFISLIEKNDNPKTVWLSDHNMWKKENRITRITDKRLWMSIIHQKNKVNEFDGYGNVNWNAINNDFVLSPSMNETILNKQVSFSKWWFLSLKNLLYVKMVLYSKILKRKLGIYKFKK